MQKNLRRTFCIQLQTQQQDLISTYYGFFQSCISKSADSVYKRWMQMPDKNEAFVLSVQKGETKKKLLELLEKSTWEEKKKNCLKWKEVIIDNQLIRIVMYDHDETDNQLFALISNDYKDHVIIHNVGSDQYEIQQLSLSQHSLNQQDHQEAKACQNHVKVQNMESKSTQIEEEEEEQLAPIQQSQEKSDNNNNDISINANPNNNININNNPNDNGNKISEENQLLKEKLEEQQKVIKLLAGKNTKKKLKVLKLKQNVVEQQQDMQKLSGDIEQYFNQLEDSKSINENLRVEIDKLKRINNNNSFDKELIEQLKQQIQEKEKELEEMRSRHQSCQDQVQYQNSQIESQQHENFENIEKILQLIQENNDLKMNTDEDQRKMLKMEKKYLAKKTKYSKLKEMLKENNNQLQEEINKCRSEVIFFQEQLHLKTQELSTTKEQHKTDLTTSHKYQKMYNDIKQFFDEEENSRSVRQTLHFEETPAISKRERLEHRLEMKNIYSRQKSCAIFQPIQEEPISVSKQNYSNISSSYSSQIKDESQRQSMIKSSVSNKNSVIQDSASYAKVLSLQSEIKGKSSTGQKDSNHESYIYTQLLTPSQYDTMKQQKEFNERVLHSQPNIGGQSIHDFLNKYEEQLNFPSVSQHSGKSENYVSAYSSYISEVRSEYSRTSYSHNVSEFNIDDALGGSHIGKSGVRSQKMSEAANKSRIQKKMKVSKYKSKNLPNKKQIIVKEQNPTLLKDNKSLRDKYLQEKKLKQKVLNKSILKQVQGKPELKERIEEMNSNSRIKTVKSIMQQGNKSFSSSAPTPSFQKKQIVNENLSLKTLLQVNKSHLKKEITK